MLSVSSQSARDLAATVRTLEVSLAAALAQRDRYRNKVAALEKQAADAQAETLALYEMLSDVRSALDAANVNHQAGEFAAHLYMAVGNALNEGFSCDLVDEIRGFDRLEARAVRAEEALRAARTAIVAVANTGWDSSRREVAANAIARIDPILAAAGADTEAGA